MKLVQGVRKYLGLDHAVVEDGFTMSERGVRLPACARCGSVVAYEAQRTHNEWHTNAGS